MVTPDMWKNGWKQVLLYFHSPVRMLRAVSRAVKRA